MSTSYVNDAISSYESAISAESASFYDNSGTVKVLTSLVQANGKISAATEVLDYN